MPAVLDFSLICLAFIPVQWYCTDCAPVASAITVRDVVDVVPAKEQGQSSVFQLEPSTVLSSYIVSTTVPDTFVAINCAVKLPTLPAV